jgi:hypothetical protein
LYFLTATKIPLIFTCANDYADLKGEVGVMQHILGAKFVIQPSENPFSFASTLVSNSVSSNKPAEAAAQDYSRGNAFLYAVQGCDKSRRTQLDCSDVGTRTVAFLSAFMRGATAGEAIALSNLEWGRSPPAIGSHASEAMEPRSTRESIDECAPKIAKPTVNSEASAISYANVVLVDKLGQSGPPNDASTSTPPPSVSPLVIEELAPTDPADAYVLILRWDPTYRREDMDSLSNIDVGYNALTNQFKFTITSGHLEQVFVPSKALQSDSLRAKYSRKRNELTLSAKPAL